MNEVRHQLLARTRLALDKDRCVRVRDVQCKLDRASYRRGTADDLALLLMKFAFEPHYFCGKLIAFERSTDLVGDTFHKCNVVLTEDAFFTPHKTE